VSALIVVLCAVVWCRCFVEVYTERGWCAVRGASLGSVDQRRVGLDVAEKSFGWISDDEA